MAVKITAPRDTLSLIHYILGMRLFLASHSITWIFFQVRQTIFRNIILIITLLIYNTILTIAKSIAQIYPKIGSQFQNVEKL